MKKRSILALFSAIVCCSNLLFGNTDAEEKPENYKYGMQFRLYNEKSLSLIKNIRDRQTLRFTFDLSGNYSDNHRDIDYTNELPDTMLTRTGTDDRKTNRQSFAITMQYFYSPVRNKHLNYYIGTGPYCSYAHNYTESKSAIDNISPELQTYQESDGTGKAVSIGWITTTGIASHITSRVALFAEYDLSFYYNWIDNESSSRSESENGSFRISKNSDTRDLWQLNLSSIRIGLCIYF